MSLLKGSLASDIYNTLTNNDLLHITKSAYSQGRYKIKSSLPDTEIKKGTKVKVRMVKVALPTGEIEVLATHLMVLQ
jgi:hypothetical protein